MNEQDTRQTLSAYAKVCNKPLTQQIRVVAEFYAHKIHPVRIAYRTGIELNFVRQLVNGDIHQRLFQSLLASQRKARRDQRLKQSLRKKGIAQAELQQQIEQEYTNSLVERS